MTDEEIAALLVKMGRVLIAVEAFHLAWTSVDESGAPTMGDFDCMDYADDIATAFGAMSQDERDAVMAMARRDG